MIAIFENLEEFIKWMQEEVPIWKKKGIQLNLDKTDIMIVGESMNLNMEEFKK